MSPSGSTSPLLGHLERAATLSIQPGLQCSSYIALILALGELKLGKSIHGFQILLKVGGLTLRPSLPPQ